ncbi:MAG: exopolyphosphatase, partial [Gammaproteobacteria bacterium]|nr:exopolyphosphatase [Gammaproteobacteria bacterium]
NSDMAGFSREEQGVLAALIRAHRRKFPLDIFHNLPEEISRCAMQLCLILRLAVLLHRARSPSPDMDVTLVADKERLVVRFPDDWLKSNPLVKMELKQEKKYLKAAGFKLKYG